MIACSLASLNTGAISGDVGSTAAEHVGRGGIWRRLSGGGYDARRGGGGGGKSGGYDGGIEVGVETIPPIDRGWV
jgi:hypothetical protein